MGEFTPYADVTLILKENNGAIVNVVLDNAWTVIEQKDTIPQSLKITLSAAFGEFLTRGIKIKKHDKIYFEWTDARGNVDHNVFLINTFNRGRKSGKGKKLILGCVHEAYYIWKRTISFTARRTSSQKALNTAIEIINDSENRGARDPIVEVVTPFDITTKTGNNLSQNNTNDYIFESKKVERVFAQIGDIEAQPPEGGGSFQPPYIRFISKYDGTNDDDLGVVLLQAYAQGFVKNTISGLFDNIPNITLIHNSDPNDTATNIFENESNEVPEQATNLELRCNKAAGEYLGDFQKFQGAKRVFNSAQPWFSGANYRKGNIVLNSQGDTYEATQDHISSGANEPPNLSFWVQRTFVIQPAWSPVIAYVENFIVTREKIAYKALNNLTIGPNQPPAADSDNWTRVFFVPTTEYSPQTKQRAQDWINALAGSKYADQDIDRTRIMTPNVIVKDALHPRTYIRWMGTDPINIPASLLVDGKIPHGFKVLAINPADGVPGGTGDFNGNDKNNIPFAGNINQYIDRDFDGSGAWEVFKGEPTNTQDHEIFDHDECLSWIKNPCEGAFSFVDGNGVCQLGTRATVWKKGAYTFEDQYSTLNHHA